MKRYFTALEKYAADPEGEMTLEEVNQKLSEAYSKIDKAVKRGVVHRNTASRRKARLAKAFKSHFPNPEATDAVAS